MRPSLDPSFVRELKGIASQLEIEWDVHLERWVIYYTNPEGQRFRVHEVKNPDGSYRHPDQRVLDMLRRCDMSTKIDDPKYLVSEQLRKSKKYKEEQIAKHKEESRRRARDQKSLWAKAIDNAQRGIYHDWQLGNRTIYSIPKGIPPKTSRDLLRKLGRPHLTGMPSLINP